MNPDLQSLLTLQEKDKAVDALNASLAALTPQVEALDAELDQLTRGIDEARRSVAGAEARRVELEGRIAGFKQQQDRRKQQLEFERADKAAAALRAEIDMARGILVKEESDFTRAGDQIVETGKRVVEAEKARVAAEEAQVEPRAALAVQRAELEQLLVAAKAERATAAKDVLPKHLVRYERTRRGKPPLVVFPLLKDSCGHCFTAVPVQRRVMIQQGVSIEACEVCGVLLYAADA